MQEKCHISEEMLARLRDAATRREAFDRVVGLFLRPLYWHVRRLVVVHEDAEDVVQESFVRAWDALEDFRGDGSELRRGSTASPPTRRSRCCGAGDAGSLPRSTT